MSTADDDDYEEIDDPVTASFSVTAYQSGKIDAGMVFPATSETQFAAFALQLNALMFEFHALCSKVATRIDQSQSQSVSPGPEGIQ